MMKEETINSKIVECIKALSLSDWCMTQSDEKTNQYLLGYIDGLVELGEQLKHEVIK